MKKLFLVMCLLATSAHAYTWEVYKDGSGWHAKGAYADTFRMTSDGFYLSSDNDLELSGKCSASQSQGLRSVGLSISWDCYDHAVQVHFYEQTLRGKTEISPSEIDSNLGSITVNMGQYMKSVGTYSPGSVHCPDGYYAVQSGQSYKCVKKTKPIVPRGEPTGNHD